MSTISNLSSSSPPPISVSNKPPILKLFWGSIGIYVCYLVSAILNQKILKSKYKPFDSEGVQAQFTYPIVFLLVPHFVGYLIGKASNSFQKQKVSVPKYNLLKISITVLISGLSFNAAILYLEFPIVILIKSCNILSVIIVGVFCSKVKENSGMKLGKQKLIVGFVVSTGIIIFFSGNQNTSISNNQESLMGFGLLAISIVADGFLPDFQAEVKQKFNPDPMVLYQKSNLWVFILSFIYILATKQIFEIVQFMQTYPSLILDVLSQSIMACVGQLFVYYLIFNFKQHVAPFVLTSRKILSGVISIIVFNHPISTFQCVGVGLMVLGICLEVTLSKVLSRVREWKKYKSYDVI